MKKIVFKGIINNEEFDNVKDYNKRMSELLGEGASIDAHSETRYADDEADTKPTVKGVAQTATNINPEIFFPFFNESDNMDGYYLDNLASGDADVDANTMSFVENHLNKTYKVFSDYIRDNRYDTDDLLKLLFNIKNIKKQIEEDRNVTNDTINSIEADIKRMEASIELDKNQLRILNSSKQFIQKIHEYYQEVFEQLKKLLLGL